MHLTESKIKSLKYSKDAPEVVFCKKLPGFGVRLHPSGKKVFILQYRFRKKRRKITLGDVKILSLDKARELAKEALVAIANGVDPVDRKNQIIHGKTIKSMLEYYLDEYSKIHKKSFQEDERRIKRFPEKFLNTPLGQITRNDVIRFHRGASKTAPYEANRQLELLSAAFNFSLLNKIYDGENPCKAIKANKEVKRDRWLTPGEFSLIWKHAGECSNPIAGMVIKFLMVTGIRESEALKAKWNQVYWDVKEMRIEAKGDKTRFIPLNEYAIDLLEQVPQKKNNPYIFFGDRKAKHLVNISKPWNRIKAAAALESESVKDVRIHDLRRTATSWLSQSGLPFNHVAQYLGHTSTHVTNVYAILANETIRAASDQHNTMISNALKEK